MKRNAKGVSLARKKADTSNTFHSISKNPTLAESEQADADDLLADLEERVNDVRESWETDSLFEDVFDELSNEDGTKVEVAVGTGCTPEEAGRLRRELREYGPAVFCQRTVDSGRYTAKKLLSAFGLRSPPFLDDQPDEAYFSLLSLAISRELSKRAKLARYNSVQDAVDLITKSNNIIVITGAGISTSLGIPDFRSKGTGLYSKLEHLGLGDPQEVFDIEVFTQDPSIFYSIAKDIVPARNRFTPTHKFIAMLHRRGKLLTNYSQNIDNLEVKAGLPKDKLIQCHGSFGTASCIRCGFQINGDKIMPEIRAGTIPRCTRCPQLLRSAQNSKTLNKSNRKGNNKRKRGGAANNRKRRRWSAADDSDDDGRYDIPEVGVMKPDITFFGEPLPHEFSKRLTKHDRDLVDLVIVIGTSLKVTPVSEIVSWLPPHIPQIYISRQPVGHINFDIDLLGDCDTVVGELCRLLEWPLNHDMIHRDQRVTIRTEPGYRSRHVFNVIQPSVAGNGTHEAEEGAAGSTETT